LAAFLFGAAHAFTPGHGKTLVAAYLVGERGTFGHAVLLGVATTIAHTGSVLLIALGLRAVYGDHPPESVAAVLQFLGGLFVLLVGFWLLLLRLTGRADHVHLFGDGHHHHRSEDRGQRTEDREDSHGHHHHGHGHHHHHHHHAPPPDAAKTRAGWARVVLLGLGGGLIPCWDAVLLLVVAIALNRFGFAIPLLIAFSLGLAVVLVLLGVAVVSAYRAGATRFHDSPWFRLLPVVSSVVLIGLGLWLCKAAASQAIS
jgi:ABC-type nickel/cobalt efflux system permease component RcnA